MIIDSHVHFWKFSPVKDVWITDEMKVIRRDFIVEDMEILFKEKKIDGCIAIQADQSENENQFLIQQANKSHFIKGIVGWVDLQSDTVEERLNYYSQWPVIKGFRHIVQAEPDGFLLKQKFLNGVGLLRSYNFTYDILVYHHQLKEAISFVHQFPEQTFILDHCAKPNIKGKEINKWKLNMKEIAQHENAYCKISGLLTEAQWNAWTKEDIKPYLDVIFEIFSSERIIYGSDWPVMMLSGKYSDWLNLLNEYTKGFSKNDIEKFFCRNAIKAYHLTVENA